MRASPELLESIQQLYTIFSGYGLPQKVDCCPCCTSDEKEAKLHSKSLRELQQDDLDYYAFCAISTMGDVDNYRHFLPRLLELKVATPCASQLLTDLEVILGKLPYGNWQTWPYVEQEAIRNFLHALWTNVLHDLSWRNEDFEYIDSFACAIARVEDDLTPYLSEWLKAESLESLVALCGLVNDSDIVSLEQGDAYWEDRQPQYLQLRRWTLSEPVAAKLRHGTKLWHETAHHKDILAALELLHKNPNSSPDTI